MDDLGFQVANGDVKITVVPDVYLLHGSVIEKNSGSLKSLFNLLRFSVSPPANHGIAPLNCLWLNLVGSPDRKYGLLEFHSLLAPELMFDEISARSYPLWPSKTRRAWSNLFKVFYGRKPTLDDSGYDSILDNSWALIDLGEELDASDAVSKNIAPVLLDFDQQLYRVISKDPVSWAKIAVRIQSAPIFQESMIHLVGKWGMINPGHRNTLPFSIREICREKMRSLVARKRVIERNIISFVPPPNTTGTPARQTSNNYLWLALAVHRQWLCHCMVESRNFTCADGGAGFYRAINAGGRTYLDKLERDMHNFRFPESKDGLKKLEDNLNQIKDGIREFVADLLVNNAKYDPEILGVLPYLTCCKVSEDDLPPRDISHGIFQLAGYEMVKKPKNSTANDLAFGLDLHPQPAVDTAMGLLADAPKDDNSNNTTPLNHLSVQDPLGDSCSWLHQQEDYREWAKRTEVTPGPAPGPPMLPFPQLPSSSGSIQQAQPSQGNDNNGFNPELFRFGPSTKPDELMKDD